MRFICWSGIEFTCFSFGCNLTLLHKRHTVNSIRDWRVNSINEICKDYYVLAEVKMLLLSLKSKSTLNIFKE